MNKTELLKLIDGALQAAYSEGEWLYRVDCPFVEVETRAVETKTALLKALGLGE
jgi:hypothetical protein